MKINTSTWHYKLWRKSFEYGERAPEETDLCRYCHKVFWQLVAYGALVSMIVAFIGMCLYGAYLFIVKGLGQNTLITLEVTGVIAAVALLVWGYTSWLKRGRGYREPKTLVGKYAQASKQKVCPLVEFTSTHEDTDW